MQVLKKDSIGIIKLKLSDKDGNILDSTGDEAMAYLHGGYGNVVLGLEKALEGKTIGDHVRVEVTPEDGYGLVVADLPKEERCIHQKHFSKEYFQQIQVGDPIGLRNSNGEVLRFYIEEKKGAYITLTRNHPLAGQSLVFDVEVVGIRAAFPEELQHGHPHGIDGTQGHHH